MQLFTLALASAAVAPAVLAQSESTYSCSQDGACYTWTVDFTNHCATQIAMSDLFTLYDVDIKYLSDPRAKEVLQCICTSADLSSRFNTEYVLLPSDWGLITNTLPLPHLRCGHCLTSDIQSTVIKAVSTCGPLSRPSHVIHGR